MKRYLVKRISARHVVLLYNILSLLYCILAK